MSPSVNITRRRWRRERDGKLVTRYVVRYRLGGRETQPMHGGSFTTRAEAETRARWLAGELAAMRVPDLRQLARAADEPTVAVAIESWLASRHDLAPNTRAGYRPAVRRVVLELGGIRVGALTPEDVVAWIGGLVESGASRSTIHHSLVVLRQALDDHRDPNPARHRTVRLPRAERSEATPPTHAHWQVILDGVSSRVRLPLRVLEGTGLRVGELQRLAWGDVDVPGGRLFVRGGKSRAARRWVPVPPALMSELEALVPREDRRAEAPVFPGLLHVTLRQAMRRACLAAGIPNYSPHDLRHRYITLLVRRGIDPAAVAALAGHAHKSMTLDTYSHLLLDEEIR